MELQDAIRRRRMVRDYDPERSVSRAQVDDLLALAVRAPSAGFSQGWRFLVLDTTAAVSRFWETTSAAGPPDNWRRKMMQAPVLIIAYCNKTEYLERYAKPDKGLTDRSADPWAVPYWYVDTGMAALLILLGAVDAGLGACLFGVPADKVDALRVEFAVPAQLEPVAVISLGYSRAGEVSRPLGGRRRPVAEVTAYNRF